VSAPRFSRRRRRWIAGGVALVALLALDLARAPAEQWTARAELAAIARYRAWLSPVLARGGVRCRFEPSCSRFAEGAIRADGALVGTLRAGWRVLRCGPWTPAGTVDPP
jgi:putative component of membrane protein insertase Oxa1/YidC/SpoIIIJ protein YidD